MKRDWECIRSILLRLEEEGDTTGYLPAERIPGFDAETASYNMKLSIEAGLIEGKCVKVPALHCVAQAMTWQGHEFLDKVRSDRVWNRVKAMAREQAVPLSFHLVGDLAAKAIGALFGG